jgi:hypothetical protein
MFHFIFSVHFNNIFFLSTQGHLPFSYPSLISHLSFQIGRELMWEKNIITVVSVIRWSFLTDT